MIETDCEVDFAPPLDYVEPSREEPPAQHSNGVASTSAAAAGAAGAAAAPPEADAEPEEPKFQAFVGSGRRLDGRSVPVRAAAPAPQGQPAGEPGCGALQGWLRLLRCKHQRQCQHQPEPQREPEIVCEHLRERQRGAADCCCACTAPRFCQELNGMRACRQRCGTLWRPPGTRATLRQGRVPDQWQQVSSWRRCSALAQACCMCLPAHARRLLDKQAAEQRAKSGAAAPPPPKQPKEPAEGQPAEEPPGFKAFQGKGRSLRD